jgi:hypothetical protein
MGLNEAITIFADDSRYASPGPPGFTTTPDGVPATEIAHRAGHGIAVLLKVYANCVEGLDSAVSHLIRDALESSGA